MQKCYYHGKTVAVTVCVGCKLPVCQTCKDEGKKGYCDKCLKHVATLGDRLGDTRKTVAAAATPELKSTIRAVGRDTRYCRHHDDIVASAACVACNRPYCPSCLNSQGVCSPCVTHNESAQAKLARPGARQRALAEAPAGPAPMSRQKQLMVGALGAVVAIVAISAMSPRHGRATSQTGDTLARLKASDLTPQEKALIAKLKVEAQTKTELADAPPAAAPARESDPVFTAPRAARAWAPAGGGAVRSARRLRVSVSAPRVASGMATLRANVAGELDRVEFSVDGQFAGAANGWPYAIDWASQNVGNGRHRVTVEAYGSDGGKAIAATTITVRN